MNEILITILLGLAVVFAGLILICFLVWLLRHASEKLSGWKKAKAEVIEQEVTDELPSELLVAILTAAIAAYTPEKAGKFRVVSFRRRPDDNAR